MDTDQRAPRWVEEIKARTKAGEVPLRPTEEFGFLGTLRLDLDPDPPLEPGVYVVRTDGGGDVRSMFHPGRLVVVRVVPGAEGELAVLSYDYEGLGPPKHWPLSATDFRNAAWAGPI